MNKQLHILQQHPPSHPTPKHTHPPFFLAADGGGACEEGGCCEGIGLQACEAKPAVGCAAGAATGGGATPAAAIWPAMRACSAIDSPAGLVGGTVGAAEVGAAAAAVGCAAAAAAAV